METPSKIKVIDRDVAVTIEMNANFIAIMQEILNNMIEEYGKENFMKLAKDIIDDNKIPQKGIELYITAMSSLVILFEKNAIEQGKSREMSIDEFSKTNEN